MIQLPNYFIRKVSGYPGGIRMPKMTPYFQGDSKDSWRSWKPLLPNLSGKPGDPLSGGDYRYWCGVIASFGTNPGFATCRACGEILFHKDERKEHKKKGCGAKLEEAYKRLRKATECIICKLETHRKVYGLPMCCKDCEFEWEMTTATPRGLRYILDELIK